MKSLTAYSLITGFCLMLFFTPAFAENPQTGSSESRKQPLEQLRNPVSPPLVTFIELGSIKCIPCRKMQPVLEAVQARYGTQVKIIFYDVWKRENHPYAKQYGIRMIPTQVFLDHNGKEFSRHAGFFPETSICQLLEKQGVKPLTTK
ncbi:co-chaperone YbbN [Chlorobium sp. KB01]|uniref:thioredoxin family protein n=1 Tax=Chlorobium sp. KB01 TaxID=1917528 RepID=UPI0009756119|nr:thioredoxin family protein [Chlorobium sp. KB01]